MEHNLETSPEQNSSPESRFPLSIQRAPSEHDNTRPGEPYDICSGKETRVNVQGRCSETMQCESISNVLEMSSLCAGESINCGHAVKVNSFVICKPPHDLAS
jgi:hypothetical protein